MLLSPQHFQQNHIYWESQFQQLSTNIALYRWGIIELALDEGQLQEGEIDILRLRAIMPDGLYIDYHSSRDNKLDISLNVSLASNEELKKNGKVKVHITVPIRVPGSASETSDIRRFKVCDGKTIKDDNTGEGDMVLQRLLPILSLQAKDHVEEQYVSLPLFEVCQLDEGQFYIGDYCPPVIGIGADNLLSFQESVQERKSLQHRLQFLAVTIRKKARQLAGFSEDDQQLGNKISEQHSLWIRAMVQHLSEFELICDNELSSPWEVYKVLARMQGSICALDPSGIPAKLDQYDHVNILSKLDKPLSYISTLISKVNVRYSSIIFDEGRDGVFSLVYDKAWIGRDLLVELKPRSNSTQSDLVQWFSACRIASSNQHKELSVKRLLGAETEQVDSDEATGLSAAPGHALFKIKIDPQYIKVGQVLVVVCTNGKLVPLQPNRIVVHLPHTPHE
jgi:type VI secretion system protein ImpJ